MTVENLLAALSWRWLPSYDKKLPCRNLNQVPPAALKLSLIHISEPTRPY